MGRRRRRRGPFHGVEVNRRATDGSGDPRASEVLIRRMCIHYEDDKKVCLIPEAREESFSQDDARRVVGSCTEVQRGTVGHRPRLRFGLT
jgi:hypothetical protein